MNSPVGRVTRSEVTSSDPESLQKLSFTVRLDFIGFIEDSEDQSQERLYFYLIVTHNPENIWYLTFMVLYSEEVSLPHPQTEGGTHSLRRSIDYVSNKYRSDTMVRPLDLTSLQKF